MAMAAKVSDNRGRLNYSARGRLGVFAVAVVLGAAACGQVVACQVEDVDMYVGRTESEAKNKYDGTYTGEDCHFWVYVEWTAVDDGDAEDEDFEIKIQKKVGANWSTVHTETGDHVKDKVDENCSIVCDFAKSFEVSVTGVLGVGINMLRATVQRLETSDVVPCDQDSWVKVVEVEMFMDSGYTDKLRDWPAEGSKARDPKYVFRKDDPIYVQVQGLGQNGTQETSPNAVKVTSPSGGPLYLDLKETSGGSQTFRNSLAANGELLYLADTTSEGNDKDKIEIADEEVLQFELRCPLIGTISSYEDSNDVMVDRAEFGVEWKGDYGTYSEYATLDNAPNATGAFYDEMEAAEWWGDFNNGDLNSEESHWDSGGDSDYVDKVDFPLWYGHGEVEYLVFFVDKIEGVKQPPDRLYWTEIDWGDLDVDWVAIWACDFLDGPDYLLLDMAAGVHLICGYKNECYNQNFGEYFVDRLQEEPVAFAWFDTNQEFNDAGTVARVFGAVDGIGDTIEQAGGPIYVGRDPTSASDYDIWDHTAE
jgi:hypothetical protein